MRKIKRRHLKQTLRVEILNRRAVCSECFYKNPNKPDLREDITGIFVGAEYGNPPGLRIGLCEKHLKILYKKIGEMI